MARKEKLIEKAQKYIQKGYLDKAISEYKSAFDLDPRDISIRLRLGDLYIKTDRREEAIKEYAEAAKANTQRGFYLKAIAVYKQVLKLDDSILDIHYRLAELYTKQRLNADAIGEYSYIVNTFEKLGKNDDAIELIKKMVEIDPENTGVRLRLAEMYQKRGFDSDALDEYSAVFDRLMAEGKLERAEKIYTSLRKSYPGNAGVLENLRRLYREKGDTAGFVDCSRELLDKASSAGAERRARELCSEILEANPGDEAATKVMERLAPAPGEGAGREEAEAEAEAETPSAAPSPSEDDEETNEAAPPAAEEAPGGEAPVEVSAGQAAAGPEEAGEEGGELEEIEISVEGFEDSADEVAPEETAAEAVEDAGGEVSAGEAMVEIDVPGLDEEEFEAAAAETAAAEAVEEGFAEETAAEAVEDAGGEDDVEASAPYAAQEEDEREAEHEDESVEPAPIGAEHIEEVVEEEGAGEEPCSASPDEGDAGAGEDICEVPSEFHNAFADALKAVEEASVKAAGEEEAGDEEYVEEEIEIEIEGPAAEEAPEIDAAAVGVDEEAPRDIEAAAAEPEAEASETPEEAAFEEAEAFAEAPSGGPSAEESPADESPVEEPAHGESAMEESLPEAAEAAPDMEAAAESAEDEGLETVEAAAEGVEETEPYESVEPEGEEYHVEAVGEAAPDLSPADESPVEEPAHGESAMEESLPEAAEGVEETEPYESVEPEGEEYHVEAAYEEPEPVETLTEKVERFLDSVPEPEAPEAAAPEAPEPETVEAVAGEPEADMGEEVEEVEEDLAEAVSDLMEKIEPEEHLLEKYHGSVASEQADAAEENESGEDYVDLTTELGMEEALESLTGSWGGDGDSESLDEFRNGIGKQLSREDTETHYNLGIAYMEMELYNEAANEFKIALKDPALEFDCYTRLGLCSMEAGAHEDAIMYYEKGMQARGRSEDERMGIMYELALACEAADDAPRAAELFAEIYATDPAYREVAEKMARYEAARPLLPLDDGMIEVELL